jgi:glycosyltransferase involved in cell wall biosynthesis
VDTRQAAQRLIAEPGGRELRFRSAGQSLVSASVWIVIPCYKVRAHIRQVLARIPAWIEGVICVDDACPERSGEFIREQTRDPRVLVLSHEINQGVGAAVLTGYAEAIRRGARIIVKIDGDDQMDLAHLPALIAPILLGEADYAKGNRFSSQNHLAGMPAIRVFGNTALGFMARLSTGYWNIFDPTNGFTAVEAGVAELLLSRAIAKRFFFETDLLYNLGVLRAVVRDVPMPARYQDEISNLKIGAIIGSFGWRHLRNFGRRLLGQYVVRDFNVATVEWGVGVVLIASGLGYALHWMAVRTPGQPASAGIVMAAALPIILGVQLLLQAVNFDITNMPVRPIHTFLREVSCLQAEERLSNEKDPQG